MNLKLRRKFKDAFGNSPTIQQKLLILAALLLKLMIMPLKSGPLRFYGKAMSNNINACFISYRHPGDPGADKYVQAFVDQLKTHLAWYLPNPSVFFDQRRLGVGDFFDPKLAYELCRSACMIIFFSPCHFDPNHPY